MIVLASGVLVLLFCAVFVMKTWRHRHERDSLTRELAALEDVLRDPQQDEARLRETIASLSLKILKHVE
jgi:septal ring factor EnvC (AmiA/AmiB activator)